MVKPSQPPEPVSDRMPTIHRWSDVFGGLILLRCLQPAFSLLTVLAAAISFYLAQFLRAQLPWSDPLPTMTTPTVWLGRGTFGEAAETLLAPAAALWYGPPRTAAWAMLAEQAIVWLIWLLPVALVVRDSLLQCAQRGGASISESVKLTARRLPALLATLVIPILAIAILAGLVAIGGSIARLSAVAAEVVMLVALPVLLAIGILAFGSLFAVPLAWASVLGEQEADAFDALSRGYEYTFRRPVQLAAYLLVAAAIHWVAMQLIGGVCHAGRLLAAQAFAFTAGNHPQPQLLPQLLDDLPAIIGILLFWSLTAGIYLLIRRDAGNQEIEDLAEINPASKPSPSTVLDSDADANT